MGKVNNKFRRSDVICRKRKNISVELYSSGFVFFFFLTFYFSSLMVGILSIYSQYVLYTDIFHNNYKKSKNQWECIYYILLQIQLQVKGVRKDP